MKKSHKLLLALVGVIVLTVVVFKAMQPKEPEYQGRRLSEWIADLGEAPPKNTEAEAVIRQMQDVVLPFVEARILKNEDPQTMPAGKRLLTGIQDKIIGRRFSKAYQWSVDFEALRVLGTNSFPVLERLMLNPESSGEASELLAKLDALEVLENGAAAHQLPFVRYYSIEGLAGISSRTNEARAALLPLTYDSDHTIILRSVNALEDLNTGSEVMVPKLCELIEKGDEDMQLYLMPLLGKYGTNAVSAIPLLEKIKSTASNSLHMISQETIDTIAPKTSP